MRPKQRAALRKLFSLPQFPTCPSSDKILVILWKNKFMEIYRNIQAFAFKVLQKCSSRNGAAQMFFSDTKQKHVCWKICKVRKVFDCVAGAYYFQCQVS